MIASNHGLNVRRRAADEAQNFAGGGQLTPRFRQLSLELPDLAGKLMRLAGD
jgi:hypothetical protein